jgi:hypothetical protein
MSCKRVLVSHLSADELADLVATRVCASLEKRLQQLGVSEALSVYANENRIAK